MPNPDSVAAVQRRHRSIRSYRPEPIAPELIDELCADAIAGASSSGNLNTASLVLTRDAARKERLYELHFGQAMVRQAPLVVTFCADFRRTRRWLALRAARDNFDNFIGFLVAAFDAIIVAQNFALGAEARGLGICYMGSTLHAAAGIAEFLHLPPGVLPVTSLVVGWPAEDPPKRDRLPLTAFVHDERYHDPSDGELDAIYAEREVRGWARYMAVPELRARIERAGIASLAQFYTSDEKYPPEVFRADSRALLDLLRRQEFFNQ